MSAAGQNGKDGAYIKNAYVDENLHLWIVLSDETQIDAGYIGTATINPTPDSDPDIEVTEPTLIVSSVKSNAGGVVQVPIIIKKIPELRERS